MCDWQFKADETLTRLSKGAHLEAQRLIQERLEKIPNQIDMLCIAFT